jgi:hypothetical protein
MNPMVRRPARPEGRVTFGDLDLTPTTKPTHDYVYEVEPYDYLGPANGQQRAECKATPAMRAFNAVLLAIVLIVTGLVLMGAGVYIGATDPSVWTDLPLTPEPSGERAEPEESAK